mmetsp:Transcript_71541/g.202105  ORF Transcript_71541/g.202105 Transcript_71541/m.202105 type:complete len:106 (-) Transcript_71541:145-462(-)
MRGVNGLLRLRPRAPPASSPNQAALPTSSTAPAAIRTNPAVVTLTSFNEWHEGTQLEPAVPHSRGSSCTVREACGEYLDYGRRGPEGYIELTRELVGKWPGAHAQ